MSMFHDAVKFVQDRTWIIKDISISGKPTTWPSEISLIENEFSSNGYYLVPYEEWQAYWKWRKSLERERLASSLGLTDTKQQ